MTRRVLALAPDSESWGRFFDGMAETKGVERVADRLDLSGCSLVFERAADAEQALDRLRQSYFALLLLDLRGGPAAALDMLRALDDVDDQEARYGFHRIIALVGDGGDETDELIAQLAARGLRHILRERPALPGEEPFPVRVLRRAAETIAARPAPHIALAASGGGITGIYFELGAMKALQDCIPGLPQAIDQFYGISAGAVVTSLMAVGYSVDEVMAALAGVPGGRIPRLDLALLKLGNLNTPDIARRVALALRGTARAGLDAVLHGQALDADALFLDTTALIGPPFRSDKFGTLLRGVLSAEGATDDFRLLPRPLFIGASDQDARERVLFGAEGFDDVPISTAVQASLSINPAFSAVRIGERWYEDGAVTRTSDFAEAVRRGATLVFVLDPFLPWVSDEPGQVDRRGMLYNVDQDLRSLSWTRFERSRNWVLRRHPEVSSYTFVPGNRLRQLLSRNPMDHRPFCAIWRGAYLSTLRRIQSLGHRLRGDLAHHGLTLDASRAQEVAARLESMEEPAFEDFYPERMVDLQIRPLVLERA